jgi:hypothetical protein
VHVEAAGDKAIDDVLNLGFRRPFLHDNDHEWLVPFLIRSMVKILPKSTAPA